MTKPHARSAAFAPGLSGLVAGPIRAVGLSALGLEPVRHCDPFEQSVVKHPQGSATNFLPAGDTDVIYPRLERPLCGQRFEAHRIGLEDADLLLQLKKRSPTHVEAIIRKVFRAYDDYTTDVTCYRRARRELLSALGAK